MSVNGEGPLALELPASLLNALAERVAAIVLERLQTSPDHRWLTVDQAADYLGCSPEDDRGSSTHVLNPGGAIASKILCVSRAHLRTRNRSRGHR